MTQTMKKFLLIAILGCCASLIATASDSVPKLINYQGKLTDETGNPLASGQYTLQFRIWDDPTNSDAGHLVWGQEYSLAVLQGVFNVILGAPGGTAIPNAGVNDIGFAFTSSRRYIGITVTKNGAGMPVSNPKEILPRQQLLSTPFALMSQSVADGSVSMPKLAPRFTNVVNGVVDVGGVALSPTTGPVNTAQIIQTIQTLTVTIQTSGRPVAVFLTNDGTGQNANLAMRTPDAGFDGGWVGASVNVEREGIYVAGGMFYFETGTPGRRLWVGLPPSAVFGMDMPPAGKHTYRLVVKNLDGGPGFLTLHSVKLVAFEL